MFERSTNEVVRACSAAHAAAQRFNADSICPEHLLLGLIQQNSGGARTVLCEMNVDLQRIQYELESIIERKPDVITIGYLPFSKEAKHVFRLSESEAVALNHNYLGTEHLLLALIQVGKSCAAKVLLNSGLTVVALRVRIQALPQISVNPPETKAIEPQSDQPKSDKRRKASFYDRFTKRARNIMSLARSEALRFNHDIIGTEHILLAILVEGSGIGLDVLLNLDVDTGKLKTALEQMMKRRPSNRNADASAKSLPLTPEAKEALKHALEESIIEDQSCIGSEHLLLGLLRQSHGLPVEVFRKFKLDRAAVSQEIREYCRHASRNQEPGENEFSCFRCGSIIHPNETSCARCGWTWN